MATWKLKLHATADGDVPGEGVAARGYLRAARDRRVNEVAVQDEDRLHLRYRSSSGEYGGELLLTAEELARIGRAEGWMAPGHDELVLPGSARDGALEAVVELLPGERLGALAIRRLAAALEAKSIGGDDRLVRCAAPHEVPAGAERELPADKGDTLVLVHGTASSTSGSFGDLSRDAATSPWNGIVRTFGGRTWAFQHASLTRSPLDNALVLASALQPIAGQPLTLLSQSRGGMVVELLALAAELTESDVREWRGRSVLRSPTDDEVEKLQQLRVQARALNIHRVVRVAAPITGTSLLAENLDAWLNVGLNGLGFLLSAATAAPWVKPVYGVFKDFALGAVGARFDRESLPGLEAMIPGSPLSLLLGAGKRGRGELVAIAGDARRPGFWDRIKHVIPRAFFRGANDLVVDTAAMGVGERLGDKQIVWHRQSRKGDRVWHLAYFGGERVRQDLVAALNPQRPFDELKRRGEGDRGALGYIRDAALGSRLLGSEETTDGSRPVVFLVPGVMGSELRFSEDPKAPKRDWERRWLAPRRLASGGMQGLSSATADQIDPTAALEGPYARLVDWLGRDCNVRVFPYDWRRPLEDAAKKLAEAIEEEMQRHGRPIAILAHSMGGLVSRLVFAGHHHTWTRMTQRGGRLVMLGTPNHGAPGIVRLLVGQDPSFQHLAFFDVTSTPEELLSCVWSMPGVVQMLPDPSVKDPGWTHTHDWGAEATWAGKRGGQSGLAPPRPAPALAARETLQSALAKAVDPAHMHYVAGRCSDGTPYEVVVDDDGAIRFKPTLNGDGSVPYRFGQLRDPVTDAPLPMWVVDATHGALADHRPAFASYKKLLFGDTNCGLARLKWDGTQPDRLWQSGNRSPMAPFAVPDLSGRTVTGWLDADLGDAERTLHVEVRLGDVVLTAPDLPVLVPVARGLRLSGPAAHLDCGLDGAISKALRQGTFTGAHGEVLPVDLPPARAGGPRRRAVLMGVGDWNQTHAGLVGPLRRAFLLAAQTWDEPGAGLAVRIPPLGSGVRGVDWLDAAVEGAIAAQRARVDSGESPGVDHLLLVELDETLAVELFRHAQAADKQPPIVLLDDERLAVAPTLQREALPFPRMDAGGSVPVHVRGLQTGRAERPVAAWQIRRQVDHEAERQGSAECFEVTWTTGHARAQICTRDVDPRVVRSVTSGRGSAGWAAPNDPDLESFLLRYHLPFELRQTLATSRDIQLTVDDAAARVPWEVLLGRQADAADGPGARLGLLRTFSQLPHRGEAQDVRPSANNGRALVVGPPDVPGMSYLAGAEEEAYTVASALSAFGVTLLVDDRARSPLTGERVRRELSRSWEVLHLAGHGQYVAGLPEQSGFLLPPLDGAVDVLSLLDLRALEGSFPSLVFINACHGGAGSHLDRAGHAASLARACIDLGARAVIAAGWAIDDGAAKAFADTFYAAMTRGVAFGEAVARARSAAAQAAPGDQTWAAYQCYGDASFVLPSASASGRKKWLLMGGVGPEAGPGDGDAQLDVVQAEVIDAVSRIQILAARHAAGLGCDAPETLAATLTAWESRLAADLLGDPQVALAFATAWLRLERVEFALEALERAKDDVRRPVMFDAALEQCRQYVAAQEPVPTPPAGDASGAGEEVVPAAATAPAAGDIALLAAPGVSPGDGGGPRQTRGGKLPRSLTGPRPAPSEPRPLFDVGVADIIKAGKFDGPEGVRVFLVSWSGGAEPAVLRVAIPPDAEGTKVWVIEVGGKTHELSRDAGSPVVYARPEARLRVWGG